MAIDLEKFKRLKDRSEKSKSDADRAVGALDEQMKKYKTDFDLETVEAGDELLTELDQEIAEIEEKYDGVMTEFETKWKEKV